MLSDRICQCCPPLSLPSCHTGRRSPWAKRRTGYLANISSMCESCPRCIPNLTGLDPLHLFFALSHGSVRHCKAAGPLPSIVYSNGVLCRRPYSCIILLRFRSSAYAVGASWERRICAPTARRRYVLCRFAAYAYDVWRPRGIPTRVRLLRYSDARFACAWIMCRASDANILVLTWL